MAQQRCKRQDLDHDDGLDGKRHVEAALRGRITRILPFGTQAQIWQYDQAVPAAEQRRERDARELRREHAAPGNVKQHRDGLRRIL